MTASTFASNTFCRYSLDRTFYAKPNTEIENRSSAPGTVYLVGAGPGDPGLITVKGLEKIRTADVIVYDYLAGSQLLQEARTDAELIYVGKTGKDHTLEQVDINELLVSKAGGARMLFD
jgi:uroporphyrinogen III methyltransferase/synthase